MLVVVSLLYFSFLWLFAASDDVVLLLPLPLETKIVKSLSEGRRRRRSNQADILFFSYELLFRSLLFKFVVFVPLVT